MRLVCSGIGIALFLATPAGAVLAQSDGAAVYRQECKSCHGVNGVPPARARDQYKKIKSLGDGGFVSSLSVDSIFTILKKGIDKDMKSFAAKLSEPDMRAVAVYIKELAEKRRTP